ncbi:MAG: pantetheine-phosphate adenylyltransferase [Propionibacteriaceae bacterium]|nr:pantetheine-phosphate adenylyltransferase [Propionibacteriaceae bacterium]
MKAVFPGSFDPFTLGHRNLVERTARLFSDVVVAVGVNSAKDYLFSFEERVTLARASVADLANVVVEPMDGLLVDFCRDHAVGTIVKGARTGGDFEAELAQAQMNASYSGIETVIVPAAAAWGFMSSTLVRQCFRGGGDVRGYVPQAVADYWNKER